MPFLHSDVFAAPFARYLNYTQPDQTEITIWGQGDEFQAVFETSSGYSVIFDPQAKAYYYAGLSSDGKSLVSTGVMAHYPAPAGLTKHLRIDPATATAVARAKRKKWDEETGLSKRWNQLKNMMLGSPVSKTLSGAELSPPSASTLGTKVGLTLLIDFSDAPATISQTNIDSFLNGDSYTGYNNNGSVKKYFSDVSGGRLTYTNVVTIYVRMNQPKSYYNDTSLDCGARGRLLINDALAILKARSDYTSTILPTFSSVTTDNYNNALAFNVYFAGGDSGVWSYGLWPHSWSLASPVALGNGKYISSYQITNVGSSLELGTFCHENGHMLCDFPDLYDYDYDSTGGAGAFSLMGHGGHGTNPSQVDAYLKTAAGWTTVTDLTSSTNVTGSLVAAPNTGYDSVYRFRKPGSTTEYFLMENRQKSGRDAGLPAAGIAVWHVDELGDRDNQSLTSNATHANYELTLVQADNLWHFESDTNSGDAKDLYYLGNSAVTYTNVLNDISSPSAHWWDGTDSGMTLRDFDSPGTTMSFAIGSLNPFIASATPVADAAGVALNTAVTATFNKAINPSTLSASSFYLNNGVTGAVKYNSATNTATFTPSVNLATNTTYTATITTAITDTEGHPMLANKTWSFTTSDGSANLLDNGTFESGFSGWSAAAVSGSATWTAVTSGSYPLTSPHDGSMMARFNSYTASSGSKTRLYLASGVQIPATATAVILKFWVNHDTGYSGYADQVQAQVSTNGSTWTDAGSPVLRYDGTTGWTQVSVDLVAYKGQTIQIGFLGTSFYGNDMYLDDVVLAVAVPEERVLTVSFSGYGSGDVAISPVNTASDTNLALSIQSGTQLTLTATARDYSDFSGFTGDCASNPCTLTMNGDKTIYASFALDADHMALIGSTYFSSLPAAYNSSAGTVIQAWGTYFADSLTCDRDKEVTIDGGYNDGYSAKSGYTILQGPLYINKGSLTVKELTIK